MKASIATRLGLSVTDVGWASAEFMRRHSTETPFTAAPELCIEIASTSSSRNAVREKMAAYLAAGASEAWIVFPQTRRFEFCGTEGLREQTSFAIDLCGPFD